MNIFIDIEIDEPYEGINDIETRKALHYKGVDDSRNQVLTNNGWIVIRLAEIQVHQNPVKCCAFIADIILKIRPIYSIPAPIIEVKKIDQVNKVQLWTKVEAEKMSREKYREKYLGIEIFGIVKDENKIFKIVDMPVVSSPKPNNKPLKQENGISKEHVYSNLEKQKLNSRNQPQGNEGINRNKKDKGGQKLLRFVPYKIGNKSALYELSGKSVLASVYDEVFYLDKDLNSTTSCIVIKDKKIAVVNSQSIISNLVWYDFLYSYNDQSNTIVVKKGTKFGIIDENSVELVPFVYKEIRDANIYQERQPFLILKENNKYGIWDCINQKICLPVAFDDITENCYVDSHNVLKIKKDNKFGLFEIHQKVLAVQCRFDDVQNYNDGYAVVKYNGNWRLCDIDGNRFVDKQKFDYIGIFKFGYSLCLRNESYCLIDKNGTEYSFPTSLKIKRDGKTFWALDNSYLKIFIRNELTSSIPYDKFLSAANSISIIDDLYIDVGSYSPKYRHYFRGAIYKLDGTLLGKHESDDLIKKNHAKNNKKTDSITDVSPNDTNWKINGDKLYYKNELKFTAPIEPLHNQHMTIGTFHLGIALLTIIWDFDAEFGVFSEEVGYLDLEGTIYWQNWISETRYKN